MVMSQLCWLSVPLLGGERPLGGEVRHLGARRVLKQTTIFNVSVHLWAIFQKSFRNSMILPAALSGSFKRTGIFACCERCSLSLCLSRGPWLVGVVFDPMLLSWMSVVFGPLLDIWKVFFFFEIWFQQHSEPLVSELNMFATIRSVS